MAGRLLFAVLSVSLLAGCRPGELHGRADDATKRRLAQGEVAGFVHETGAHAWLGIPFAQPPIGDLRWKAPRPPAPHEGTLEATRFGASCVQFAGPLGSRDDADAGEPSGNEDCLYLNVFAPAFAPDAVPGPGERLPVMLWIHGGGNTIGDAVLYDGSWLATQGDVILVTVHYRLGVLGWFSHPALRGDGTNADDRSGNYGTLDLVRALEWVEQNIAAFGGDPRNVTVFGESAGGSNTVSMMLSPRASGLFHRAIVQSGGFHTATRVEAENWQDDAQPGDVRSSRELIAGWLLAAGKATDSASARAVHDRMPPDELADFLRSIPAHDLLSGFDGDRLGGMYHAVTLIRDGRVLPDAEPIDVLRAGLHNRVPAILGTNLHENRLFTAFASPHVSTLFGLPFRIRDLRRYELEADYPSLMWKARSVDEPASVLREAQGATVFAYRFDWDDSGGLPWLDFGELLGAAHGLEIPFVFGRLSFFGIGWPVFPGATEVEDMALSDAMMSYWTRFARTGDPGRGRNDELPHWKAWSDGGPDRFIVFDSENDRGIRMDDDSVTRDEVVRRIGSDERFLSDDERCPIYRSLVLWGDGVSREDYATLHGGLCASRFPLEAGL